MAGSKFSLPISRTTIKRPKNITVYTKSDMEDVCFAIDTFLFCEKENTENSVSWMYNKSKKAVQL